MKDKKRKKRKKRKRKSEREKNKRYCAMGSIGRSRKKFLDPGGILRWLHHVLLNKFSNQNVVDLKKSYIENKKYCQCQYKKILGCRERICIYVCYLYDSSLYLFWSFPP